MSEVGAFGSSNAFDSLLDHSQAHAAAERICARARAVTGITFDWDVMKQDRDEGRRSSYGRFVE